MRACVFHTSTTSTRVSRGAGGPGGEGGKGGKGVLVPRAVLKDRDFGRLCENVFMYVCVEGADGAAAGGGF